MIHLQRGGSTAYPRNVEYRMRKIREALPIQGYWLDCGCADGGYSAALSENGARHVFGIDIEIDRLWKAKKRNAENAADFAGAVAEFLPFPDQSFDAVLMNEVFEHVADERQSLREVFRVLRPGGHLALVSPNRWFPFEGHGMIVGRLNIGIPVPILPWLPYSWARPFMDARNYWPGQLRAMVSDSGFEVVGSKSVMPVFEVYRWLPPSLIRWYWEGLPRFEKLPVIRKFGVSTFVLARRPKG